MIGITAAAAIGVALLIVVLATSAGGGGAPVAPPAGTADTATPAPSPRPTATPEASPTPIAHPGVLDGIPLSDEEWEARKDLLPLAVMVDNTTGAYPHAGLDRADIVYEAFVEGGITRLMAVYWRRDAEKILPVRSARTPFVIWASELGAMYGHAGGPATENDANALGQIVEWGVPDLNAFSPVPSDHYFRDGERVGPYDLATSTASLREAASRLGYNGPPNVEPWRFREPGASPPKGQPAEGVEIDFSGRRYAWQYIQWKWEAAARRYMRFQFGGPHLDAVSNQQLAFATVVVMEAPSQVLDEEGHLIYEQLGSGPATVFTGGQAYDGTWKKAKRESRTRFFAENGEEITFERGPIFVEFISSQSRFGFVANVGDLPDLPAYEPAPPGSSPSPEHPEPSQTPTPEASPSPSVTPKPSPTLSPTPSGPPTATPTPSATPSPTIDPTL